MLSHAEIVICITGYGNASNEILCRIGHFFRTLCLVRLRDAAF